MIFYIYKFENKINEKCFLGLTRNPHTNYTYNFCRLKNNLHYNSFLQDEFNKFGEDAFIYTILNKYENEEEATKDLIYLIKNLRELGFSLNKRYGSKGSKINTIENKKNIISLKKLKEEIKGVYNNV